MENQKITLKDLFIGPAKNAMIEFFRSLFVGGVAFVADFGVLTLSKEFFGASVITAATIGFTVGVVVNYLMSLLWAFRSSSVENAVLRFMLFVVFAIVGLLINNAIISAFDGPLAERGILGSAIDTGYYYMIGKIVATVVVFFWNFFSRKLVLFRGKKSD